MMVHAEPKQSDREKYERFAHICLEAVKHSPDQELRGHLREMAAEWLKLAGQMP